MGDIIRLLSVLLCVGVVLTGAMVSGATNNATYDVHVGFKVNTVNDISPARSARECAALCNGNGVCQSATYSSGTKQCQLSTEGAADITDMADPLLKTITATGNSGPAGPSYMGTEFYTGVMLNIEPSNPVFWLVSTVATSVRIVIPILAVDETFIVDGAVSKLYTSTLEHTTDGEHASKGVYITSVDPISVYQCDDVYGSVDATIVLPLEGIGQEYVIQSTPNTGASYLNMMLITSTANNTQVSVNITGTVTTYTLNRLDTLFRYTNAVNGATVTSTAPVSVQSGNECVWIPASTGACDFVSEILAPEESFGTTFIVPYMHPRTDYTIGLVAKAANTQITIRNAANVLLDSFVMNRGDVAYREYNGSTSVFIGSSLGIWVTQYGHGYDSSAVYGDPSMMNVPPWEKMGHTYNVYIPIDTMVIVALVVDNEIMIQFNGTLVATFLAAHSITTPLGAKRAAYIDPVPGPLRITHANTVPFAAFVYGGHSHGEFSYSAGWLK